VFREAAEEVHIIFIAIFLLFFIFAEWIVHNFIIFIMIISIWI
jgi:hypothetical protein